MTVLPEQLAQALIGRQRVANAEAQRHADQLQRQLIDALRPLKKTFPFRQVWLIGSLAWGGFGTRSDVDIVVEGLSLEDVPILWSRLVVALNWQVDLLRLEDLPKAFRDRVLAEGVKLDVA